MLPSESPGNLSTSALIMVWFFSVYQYFRPPPLYFFVVDRGVVCRSSVWVAETRMMNYWMHFLDMVKDDSCNLCDWWVINYWR